MTIALPVASTTRQPALIWDPVRSLYRCPTCARTPQNLRLGEVEVFVCPDCATYWPARTAASTGVCDDTAAAAEYRDHGCLDRVDPDTDTDTDTAAVGINATPREHRPTAA